MDSLGRRNDQFFEKKEQKRGKDKQPCQDDRPWKRCSGRLCFANADECSPIKRVCVTVQFGLC